MFNSHLGNTYRYVHQTRCWISVHYTKPCFRHLWSGWYRDLHICSANKRITRLTPKPTTNQDFLYWLRYISDILKSCYLSASILFTNQTNVTKNIILEEITNMVMFNPNILTLESQCLLSVGICFVSLTDQHDKMKKKLVHTHHINLASVFGI